MLTIDTIPLWEMMNDDCGMMNDELKANCFEFITPHSSFRLFVSRVATAAAAELPELQALRRRLLVLRRHVIATLAFRALKHDVIAWHNSPSALKQSCRRSLY